MSEWISVKDRLPENSGVVFAAFGNKFALAVHYSAKYQEFNWFDDFEEPTESKRGFQDVTHWMPISLPSKEEPLTLEEPLTMDEMRQMMGRPVWCENGYGYSCWCLVSDLYSDNDCVSAIDGDTGLWDGAFYGMVGDSKNGLNHNGWLAYRRPPKLDR